MKRKHLMILTSIILIISFSISTLISYMSLRKLMDENIEKNAAAFAAEISSDINNNFGRLSTIAKSINTSALNYVLDSGVDFEEDDLEALYTSCLNDYMRAFECDTAFLVDEATMKYYDESGFVKTLDADSDSEDGWYDPLSIVKYSTFLVTQKNETVHNRDAIYVINRITAADGKLLGVIGIGFDTDDLASSISQYALGYGLHLSVVTPNGQIQISDIPSQIGSVAAASTTSLIKSYRLDSEYNYSPEGRGYVLVKYLKSCGWYLNIQCNSVHNVSYSNLLKDSFLGFAFVFFLILLSLCVILHIQEKREEKLIHLSTTDDMTGLYNRRAYDSAILEFNASKLPPDLVVISCDLNGLKFVNDHLGHFNGDELIMAAANCLQDVFSKYGNVYRVGGDEFAIIIHVGNLLLASLLDQLNHSIERWNHLHNITLSLSVGVAGAFEFPETSITDLEKISDRRMYDNKELYYLSHNIERRRSQR